MSKEVELNIKIDKNGKIFIEPKGTQGKECLDLMKFLDKIQGINIIETKANKDMDVKSVSSNQHQQT